jgi:hypothetical protein
MYSSVGASLWIGPRTREEDKIKKRYNNTYIISIETYYYIYHYLLTADLQSYMTTNPSLTIPPLGRNKVSEFPPLSIGKEEDRNFPFKRKG